VVKTGRLAWLVWVIGVFAYAAAIMQRTSLGVLGQQTSDHFGTSVSIISTFVMVQLATYAIAQTPVGVLVDRYGSRTVMICGSAVLVTAQTIMAFADVLELFRSAGDAVAWTLVSPAPNYPTEESSGAYVSGTDSPAGPALSAADMALALVDEAERDAHRGTRFTVASA